jgi:hypothetical protein
MSGSVAMKSTRAVKGAIVQSGKGAIAWIVVTEGPAGRALTAKVMTTKVAGPQKR